MRGVRWGGGGGGGGCMRGVKGGIVGEQYSPLIYQFSILAIRGVSKGVG